VEVALITDTHVAPQAAACNRNCQAAMAFIDAAGFDLAIHLGDITVDGAADFAQFDFAQALFAPYGTPIRFLPGNHDMGDNPGGEADAAHPTAGPRQLGAWRARFGEDRWLVKRDGWSLIGVNAQVLGLGDKEEQAQSTWLADVAARASGPVALFLHKPLFRDGPGDTHRHSRYAALEARRQIMRLFEGKDLRLVASGHTHQWRRLRADRVEHVWAPSSAFVFPDSFQERIGEKVVGMVRLRLSPQGSCSAELLTPTGLAFNNLSDHPDLYPSLAGRLRRPIAD
jgi:3',5'-cyclic AMP phosphodiesterase CpdA